MPFKNSADVGEAEALTVTEKIKPLVARIVTRLGTGGSRQREILECVQEMAIISSSSDRCQDRA